MMIVPEAVLFDLDDTLFAQADWLCGAWAAVGAAAARASGIDPARVVAALHDVAAEGTAQGSIIDRAIGRLGLQLDVAPLVEVFRAHRPARLEPYPQVAEGLARLASVVPVGLVSDGDPGIQQGKIDALGIGDCFATVVLSDTLGRERRKPHPAPFRLAAERLGREAGKIVFVGDNPRKDIVGALALGMTTVRVHTGEYGAAADAWRPHHDVPDAAAAIDLLLSVAAVGVSAVAGRRGTPGSRPVRRGRSVRAGRPPR